MTLRATDEQIDRELRRRQLAKRLTAHQARTQTICATTALTRHQLATLRRRWNVPQEERFRGPPPSSLEMFTRTVQGQTEGAALYALCRILGALHTGRGVRGDKQFASVEAGERLCDVVEGCRVFFPRLQVDIEQIRMLAIGVLDGDQVTIANCVNCDALVLMERLSSRRRLCVHCRRARQTLLESPETGMERGLESSDTDDVQGRLF